MKSEIWVIGGGKGGTGKSFLTSSMGMKLAQMGKRVTLIDADLGGANLHTFLKIKKPEYSLTDFFERKIPLSDIIKDTDIPNLRFITGDIRSLDSTGIKYTQKLRLYRHIKSISADYVLIDLGAGSGPNTIDTFLIADKMIAVTMPEITAIENLYLLIKKVLFRRLNRVLSEHGLRDAAKKAWNHKTSKNIKSIRDLILYLKSLSPDIDIVVNKALSEFKLHLILNQVKNDRHIETGFDTKSVLCKYFGIDARLMGYISFTEFFWKFVKESGAFRPVTLTASTSQEISSVVQNILENKQVKIPGLSNE